MFEKIFSKILENVLKKIENFRKKFEIFSKIFEFFFQKFLAKSYLYNFKNFLLAKMPADFL